MKFEIGSQVESGLGIDVRQGEGRLRSLNATSLSASCRAASDDRKPIGVVQTKSPQRTMTINAIKRRSYPVTPKINPGTNWTDIEINGVKPKDMSFG